MSLIVEDGTGLPDANSYVSVADASAFLTARGLGSVDSQHLIKAFDFINRKWLYKGKPLVATQSGEFPRDSNGVPARVIQAQCETAYEIKRGFEPYQKTSSQVTKQSVSVGPVSKTVETMAGELPELRTVEQTLARFIASEATVSGPKFATINIVR